jgi:uncharacterized protein
MPLPQPRDQGAALVTGASSGIGEQFARRLAFRGYNVLLVARRRQRLESLGTQLSGMAVRAEVLDADLHEPDQIRAIPERVGALGLEVDVLVNNAGFGHAGLFAETTLESQVGQIRVNCEALVTLTHAFLPGMLERGSGTIVNVASAAGLQPIPREAVYAASKAFALSFTEALHVETRRSGVSVVAVSPGPVPTEWQAVAGYESVPSFPPPVSPERVVDEALEAAERDRRAVIPGRMVRISMLATRSIPNTVKLPVIERMYRSR